MKSNNLLTRAALLGSLLALSWTVPAADSKGELKPYPLTKCIISGEKIGDMGKAHAIECQGRQIKFCCPDCVGEFNKTPAKYLAKLDAAAKVAAKQHPYRLKTCLVSDEKLGGDMGKPFTFVYADREIKFCCESCLKDFNKDPDKYMKKLAAADKGAKK